MIAQLQNTRMYLQATLVFIQALTQYFIVVGICNIKFKEENKLIRLLGLHLFEQKS